MLARGIGRDDRCDAVLGKKIAQGSGVIGAVGQQAPLGATDGEQGPGALKIVGVARREDKGDGAAGVVGQRVDLRRPAAARGANGVMTSPPFAPAAER